MGHARDDLTLFMPFSGDDHHIPVTHHFDGGLDGGAAIADLDGVGAAGADLGADGGGIFRTRIVVGDDGDIGQTPGDGAHQRPLAAIPVAAGAEDHDQPPRRMRPQGVQHRLQPVGGVGVVDIDLAAPSCFLAGLSAADALQAALGAGQALPSVTTAVSEGASGLASRQPCDVCTHCCLPTTTFVTPPS